MKTKKTIGILPLLLIYFGATFNIAIAENPEVKIIALDSQGNPFSINMCVYYFVNSTRNIVIADCGDTDDNFGTYPVNGVQKTINGAFDIGDSDTSTPTLSGVPAANKIYISISNYYCELTFDSGQRGDLVFVYYNATNSFSLLSNNSGYSVSGTYTWNDKTITLRNNMGKDNATGIVYLNSESIQTNSSGATRTRDVVTFPHTISGEEQSIDGVFRKWRNWDGIYSNISRELASNNYDLTANYARQYTASISTSMGGGYVYVNGVQHNCPTSGAYIYDDLNNSITAPDQEYNGFSCTFSQWKESGSFKSSQNTIYYNEPSSSPSLVAEFTYKISNVGESLYFGSNQNNPIVLNWTNNSNATGYEIWRKVRTNGVWGNPYQIAIVTNGSGTYTDTDYKLNAWKQGTELEYDVRA